MPAVAAVHYRFYEGYMRRAGQEPARWGTMKCLS